MLYNIPLSDTAWSERVDEIVESEDINDLYRFFDMYIEHVKAENRRRR